ncbi:MAG: hypothetical protein KDH96_09540, partial [Candidatus Riesia sp.]|nr:hypothetical protein [Candidatus Riesia sp.]
REFFVLGNIDTTVVKDTEIDMGKIDNNTREIENENLGKITENINQQKEVELGKIDTSKKTKGKEDLGKAYEEPNKNNDDREYLDRV